MLSKLLKRLEVTMQQIEHVIS